MQDQAPMRCGGCGAKVGADVLARALQNMEVIASPDVQIGLQSPDDAAVVQVPAGQHLVQTVDFFRAFIDDPYRFGQIAANHALGDIFAMGARPHTALAIVTVPWMDERSTEQTLLEMMQGAVQVLNQAGCALVGGHTGEGQETAMGFAIQGLLPVGEAPLRKAGMQVGDVLILSKPLGTGVLMAALPQAPTLEGFEGVWIEAALDVMAQSNQEAARILQSHGATACTDVTGFGLLGHASEMAQASEVLVRLEVASLPLLAGALHCTAAGIQSTLAPSNAKRRQDPANPAIALRDEGLPAHHTALLFDPQTAGGLLASVPAKQVQACLQALRDAGYQQACPVGVVLASKRSAVAITPPPKQTSPS